MSWGREGIGSKEGGGHGIDQKGSQVGELDGPPLLKSLRRYMKALGRQESARRNDRP